MNKAFIKTFTISFLGLLGAYLVLFEYCNPHMTGFFKYEGNKKWHVNLEYAKFDQIKDVNKSIETLVVGSSTSEAYKSADVSHVFGGESYIVSLGGADTATRHVIIKEALKHLPNLKRIIYVADFFEFNRELAKPMVAFQPEMQKYLQQSSIPGVVDFFKYYLSNSVLEDSFNILKRKRKNKTLVINKDGTMNQSMILSPLDADSLNGLQLSKEQKEKLTEQIRENFGTYKNSVLNEMKRLNPKVVLMYEEMASLVQKKKVKLLYFLSPYHHDFREMLRDIPEFSENYQAWRSFMTSYDENKWLSTFDSLESGVATNSLSPRWRDGIHYNRKTAFEFLIGAKLLED